MAQKETRLKLEFVANTDHSIHAVLVVVEAMARRFGLWNKVRQLSCLDPRRDRKRGYGPKVIVGQMIDALCSGGGCLNNHYQPAFKLERREKQGGRTRRIYEQSPAHAV